MAMIAFQRHWYEVDIVGATAERAGTGGADFRGVMTRPDWARAGMLPHPVSLRRLAISRDTRGGEVTMWWSSSPDENAWLEIRKLPGIGTSLSSPVTDEDGGFDPWYNLVGQVRRGDRVYHYNARESRFVGRSRAAGDARVVDDRYAVPLRDFEPVVANIDLAYFRGKASEIYDLNDRLLAAHGRPLYLPFQFTKKRSDIKMMSNYFTKMPLELIDLLFGADGLANGELVTLPPAPGEEPDGPSDANTKVPSPPQAFLQPFRPKADSNYTVNIEGGQRRRSRKHEALVNACADWLAAQGFETGRNAAIDLGTVDPHVIIEAKIVSKGAWAIPVRQAVGQLYEYRFFKVASPSDGLVFLANKPVPKAWLDYLEKDRGIGAIWREGGTFKASKVAKAALGL